ncbi:hypothetical protein Tco_0689568 [Tanacetum coccineum]
MKVEESLNVTFDESPPPTKLSPLFDDDVGEEEAINKNTKVVNNNNEEDESIEVDKIVNIKESKNHLLDQVIGNFNQRTLRVYGIENVIFANLNSFLSPVFIVSEKCLDMPYREVNTTYRVDFLGVHDKIKSIKINYHQSHLLHIDQLCIRRIGEE